MIIKILKKGFAVACSMPLKGNNSNNSGTHQRTPRKVDQQRAGCFHFGSCYIDHTNTLRIMDQWAKFEKTLPREHPEESSSYYESEMWEQKRCKLYRGKI